jgi:hypothetical protein
MVEAHQEDRTMLSVSSYPQSYVDDCRRRVQRQLATYDAVVAAADPAAVDAFAGELFRNLVLALDALFLHRGRGQEGKDGNPLNEVRMLCTSIRENGAVLKADSTIKYQPEQSVLGLAIGADVNLTEPDFASLADAFLQEIEKRFP